MGMYSEAVVSNFISEHLLDAGKEHIVRGILDFIHERDFELEDASVTIDIDGSKTISVWVSKGIWHEFEATRIKVIRNGYSFIVIAIAMSEEFSLLNDYITLEEAKHERDLLMSIRDPNKSGKTARSI